jgi:hypothetical protein
MSWFGVPGCRAAWVRQERLPHSELAAARARGGCEDKGRRFALAGRESVTAEPGDQGAGQRRGEG